VENIESEIEEEEEEEAIARKGNQKTDFPLRNGKNRI
jgi:hypothetical protein